MNNTSQSQTTAQARPTEIPIQDRDDQCIDLRKIKVQQDEFGMMTYDPGFTNTASCKSRITYIDRDKGILEYQANRAVIDRAAFCSRLSDPPATASAGSVGPLGTAYYAPHLYLKI